jgi:nucleotidyltransferase/DNA polymerase involved in DNA repair
MATAGAAWDVRGTQAWGAAVVALWWPDFALRVRLLASPCGNAALLDREGVAARVSQCSHVAHAAGVRPGMDAVAARIACPDVELLPPDPAATMAAWQTVLARVAALAQRLESPAVGLAWLSVAGRHPTAAVDALLGHAGAVGGAFGPPRVGVAVTRYLATVAARFLTAPDAARAVFVTPGREAHVLGGVDVAALPVTRAQTEALRALGIDTLGKVAALPAVALRMHFGRCAEHWASLVRGEHDDAGPCET